MSPMVFSLNIRTSSSSTRMMVIRCNFILQTLYNSLIERYTYNCNIYYFLDSGEGCEKAFAYFWITDSCPLTVKAIDNRAPFEVLSLAGSIADALQI